MGVQPGPISRQLEAAFQERFALAVWPCRNHFSGAAGMRAILLAAICGKQPDRAGRAVMPGWLHAIAGGFVLEFSLAIKVFAER
jgi:hypothetical protein